MKLSEIIKEIQESVKESKLKVKDDTILEMATKIGISREIQNNKDVYQNTKKAYPEAPIISQKTYNPNEPMTDKQKNFLVLNKYEGSMNLSKGEAHALIKGFKERQGEQY